MGRAGGPALAAAGGARVRASARLRAAGGRVCAGGREGKREESARAARAPALPASRPPRCLPPARTGYPPPPLLLAPALHRSLPAARFVLPPEDGSDLSQLGSYLKRRERAVFPISVEEPEKDPVTLPQTR